MIPIKERNNITSATDLNCSNSTTKIKNISRLISANYMSSGDIIEEGNTEAEVPLVVVMIDEFYTKTARQ